MGGGVLGFGFIIAFQYLGYRPYILYWWTTTSSLATLFLYPLFYLICKKQTLFHGKVLEAIGRNSYFIYLAQMIYFHFDIFRYFSVLEAGKWLVCINIMVCVISGIAFSWVNDHGLALIVKVLKRNS